MEPAVQNRIRQTHGQHGHKQMLKERDRDVPLASAMQKFWVLGEYKGSELQRVAVLVCSHYCLRILGMIVA